MYYVLFGGPWANFAERSKVLGLLPLILVVAGVATWGWKRWRLANLGVSTREQVDSALDRFAARTFNTWSKRAVSWGIELPSPARVRWGWAEADVSLSREELVRSPLLATDPRPLPRGEQTSNSEDVLNSGVVTRMHDELYARLGHGRLVLIGAPGAGKTGAMVLMLLEALQHRERLPAPARGGVPVPVWLTMGSWDPSSQSVRDWVVANIARQHQYLRAPENYGPAVIPQMLEEKRVALFLDGLDEMPKDRRLKAIELLAKEAPGLRLVLTSRPDEYSSVLEAGEHLPNAAVVRLRPVRAAAAAEFLLEGQVGGLRHSWQQVADRLRADPSGTLAQTLDTPLTLSLARSAYARRDPTGLLSDEFKTEQQLRAHLLDQVLVSAYTNPRERDHASHWLGWIAKQMASGDLDGPTRDLQWWDMALWAGPRNLSRTLDLTIRVLIGLAAGLPVWLKYSPALGLAAAILGALAAIYFLGRSEDWREMPMSLSIHRPARSEIFRGYSSILIPLAVVPLLLASQVALSPIIGRSLDWTEMRNNAILLLLALPLLSLASNIWHSWIKPLEVTEDVTPESSYRQDGWYRLVVAALSGIFALFFVVPYMSAFGIFTFHWVALGAALAGTAAAVSVLFRGPAPRIWLAQAALSIQGRSVRFMPLLRSALEKQVLRQAGTVYQFRHAELQDRLAEVFGSPYAAGRKRDELRSGRFREFDY